MFLVKANKTLQQKLYQSGAIFARKLDRFFDVKKMKAHTEKKRALKSA